MGERITLADGTELDVGRWPLPEGVEDDPEVFMNRAQLAQAFVVSENTISKWVDRGMPVAKVGSNGTAYEFRFPHCWAWWNWREETKARARSAADRMAQQAALAFRNLDEDEAERHGTLSAKELRELAEADYHRNRAAEQRGELVRADRVRAALQDVFVAVRTNLTTLPDFLELEFGLSNADVEKAQRRCDDLLVQIRQSIEETLGAQAAEAVPLRPEQDDMAL